MWFLANVVSLAAVFRDVTQRSPERRSSHQWKTMEFSSNHGVFIRLSARAPDFTAAVAFYFVAFARTCHWRLLKTNPTARFFFDLRFPTYYAHFLEVTFVHKMYICVFLLILSHFCLMLNRERRESLRRKSLRYTHWKKWGHMIGYLLTLVGIPDLAGNLKIT